MGFVKNAWYVACWGRDLIDRPRAETVLGEKVVLCRGRDGTVRAAENLCPHRFLPLSKGKVQDNDLQCGYHGLTFDGDGICVDAPTQDALPVDCRVPAYPVHEQMGLVWIWMGEAALAPSVDVYDLPEFHLDGWGVAHGDALEVEANYLLLCDNLCDPTHVNYVHPSTLGNPDGINAPVSHEDKPWGVLTERFTENSTPTGFVQAFSDYEGKVDMWQRYLMYLPSVSIIDFGATAAGTGNWDTGGDARIHLYSCHFMTPVNEAHTIDRWLHVRNFEPENISVGERISEQFRSAFAEDKVILEAVQAEEMYHSDRLKVGLDLDVSAGLFRSKVNRLLRMEGNSELPD